MNKVLSRIGHPASHRKDAGVECKCINADESQQELGDRHTYHSNNTQDLVQDRSLFKGTDNPQKNTENRGHDQGGKGQLNGCRKVVLHQGNDRDTALQAVSEITVKHSGQPL